MFFEKIDLPRLTSEQVQCKVMFYDYERRFFKYLRVTEQLSWANLDIL